MFSSRKPYASGDPLSRDPRGLVLLAVYIALLIGLASVASAQTPTAESKALQAAVGSGFGHHWVLNTELDSTGENPPGTTAYWDSSVLVVESTRAEGPSVVERYELVEGARRLVITATITLPDGGDPVTVRRVYDAAEITS